MCNHQFDIRKWGMECRCGHYVDMGRPATDRECDREVTLRRDAMEVQTRMERAEQSQHVYDLFAAEGACN